MKKDLYILSGLFIIVLLIALISYFNEDFEKTKLLSLDDLERDIFCLENVDFEIISGCTNENNLKVNILNNKFTLDGFLINGVKKENKLIEGQNKEFIIENNLNEISVFGIIKVKDTEIKCNNFKVYKDVQSCSNICNDGTFFNKCSEKRPFYCDKGNLIQNCKVCGCNGDFSCNGNICSSCKEAWLCSEYSECTEGKQKRGCFDLNKCKTELNKPATEKNC